MARRSAGLSPGSCAAAAISTFLLSYQVAIWLATDAPLLAAVSVALLGRLPSVFMPGQTRERLRGYTLMHAALAARVLEQERRRLDGARARAHHACRLGETLARAAALGTVCRDWRCRRAIILSWVWFVYAGQDGPEHLKVFFWNNLVGRFTHVDAPQELQYAAGHRNSPGKYLLELPMYLWPWTLLVAAAARRALAATPCAVRGERPVRFALASSLPALAVLSVAATARNIYLAPALPGFALLLGWWARETAKAADRWDVYAMRGTAVLLLLAALVFVAALALLGADAWGGASVRFGLVAISALGLIAAAASRSACPRRQPVAGSCCRHWPLCCSRTAPCWRVPLPRFTVPSMPGRTCRPSAAQSRPTLEADP